MRVELLVLVTLFVTSCGVQTRSPWPAKISNLNGMTPEEQEQVLGAVKTLNSLSEKEVLSVESTSSESFTISIHKATQDEEHKMRAGVATVQMAGCSIDLSSLLFEKHMVDFIQPVLFHEVGHCAGLEHSPDETDIMFKTTAQNSKYSQEAIDRFIKRLREAAGL